MCGHQAVRRPARREYVWRPWARAAPNSAPWLPTRRPPRPPRRRPAATPSLLTRSCQLVRLCVGPEARPRTVASTVARPCGRGSLSRHRQESRRATVRLQNRQGGAARRLDGSIPSPLRGEKSWTRRGLRRRRASGARKSTVPPLRKLPCAGASDSRATIARNPHSCSGLARVAPAFGLGRDPHSAGASRGSVRTQAGRVGTVWSPNRRPGHVAARPSPRRHRSGTPDLCEQRTASWAARHLGQEAKKESEVAPKGTPRCARERRVEACSAPWAGPRTPS